MPHSQSVITFATNKLSYVAFALNCAQSIILNNDLPVFIISNLEFPIPGHLKNNVFIVKAKPEHLALGIGIKLYMNEYLQTENTLFIDSDCLCYGSLQPIFAACQGKNVSVAGTMVNSAEWCGEIQAKAIEKEFGIKKLPRFNGGLYFMKNTPRTAEIFQFAQSIIPIYDTIGLQRINNKWLNEEGPIGISMVIHGETPIPDDGRYMTDLFTDPHPAKLNVLKRVRELHNQPVGHREHRPWYPVGIYSPVIVHFGGQKLWNFPYITQSALLKMDSYHFNKNLSTIISNVALATPYKVARVLLSFARKMKAMLKR